ncbi:MAG: class I SAM-dependent methyltransferase [Nanoarchaeota archaeon]|nr:class I SAM-dependent methyltransferase [Nanoarchaeota archaeon]
MKQNKDAYGQEVWFAFNRKDSYEIVERDDGFVGLSGGAKSYFAEFKDWPKWQKQAIKFAKGKVLDIGCGAGRVGLHLQNKGFNVTSIDNSPLAIKVCKKRGLKNTKVMPIEQINKFRNNSFDTVIMLGNNFGLLSNFTKAKKLLKLLHKITSQDALIIAESNDPYKTDDPVHLSYHKLNKTKGKMAGQLKIRVRFKNYIGDWFDYLLVSKKEMEQILKGTGWRVKEYIDSSKHMYIAIIEKH